MKQFTHSKLRRLLILAAVVILLTMSLTACFGKNGQDETVNKLPSETTGTPSSPSETVPPTTDPPSTSVWGTVNQDKLNVRAEPSTDSLPNPDKLAIHTRVEILETKVVGDVTWGRIETGWVNMTYITLDGQTPPTEPPKPQDPTNPSEPKDDPTEPTKPASTNSTKGTVTADTLNIRKKASSSSDSEIVGKYKKGDKIEILEIKSGWGRTDKGWVSMKYVKTEGGTGTTTPSDPDDKTGTVKDVVTDNNTKVLGYGVVNIGTLNVRSGPGTKYVVTAKVTSGQRLPYYQKSGSWVRIEKGWVSASSTYFNIDGDIKAGSKGTVTSATLNIRKEASSSSDKVGTYKKGDKVEILEVKNNWGRTDKGWISLTYVKLDTSTTPTTPTVTAGTKGTITAETLNIRKEGNTSSDKVGSYKKGDKVEILEVKNGWGRTDKGWISLKYFKADAGSQSTNDGNKTALGYGVVTNSTLNVRKGPGTDYDVTGSVTEGQRFAYYQKSGKWVRLEKGWVSTTYFYIEGTKGSNAGPGTVTGEKVRLRTGPGTSFDIKGERNVGDKVNILAQITVGGQTWGYTKDGWMYMQYVKMD